MTALSGSTGSACSAGSTGSTPGPVTLSASLVSTSSPALSGLSALAAAARAEHKWSFVVDASAWPFVKKYQLSPSGPIMCKERSQKLASTTSAELTSTSSERLVLGGDQFDEEDDDDVVHSSNPTAADIDAPNVFKLFPTSLGASHAPLATLLDARELHLLNLSGSGFIIFKVDNRKYSVCSMPLAFMFHSICRIGFTCASLTSNSQSMYIRFVCGFCLAMCCACD